MSDTIIYVNDVKVTIATKEIEYQVEQKIEAIVKKTVQRIVNKRANEMIADGNIRQKVQSAVAYEMMKFIDGEKL